MLSAPFSTCDLGSVDTGATDITEVEIFPAHRATQALVLVLKEAMVPVNKGVVSYSQTFILAQASHIGFPLWSVPLYPRPTRMQTPSYRKRQRKDNKNTSLFFLFLFFLKGRAGDILILCSLDSTTADGENELKSSLFD